MNSQLEQNTIKTGTIKPNHIDVSDLNIKYFNERFFPLGINHEKLQIFEKIINNSQPVRNFVDYWYGKGNMTSKVNFLKKGVKLLTGKEIMRYGFNTKIKPWFLDEKYLNNKDRQRRVSQKVTAQDIVAHITKPVPHIKLTASIDYESRFCLNTVMCFSEKNILEMNF